MSTATDEQSSSFEGEIRSERIQPADVELQVTIAGPMDDDEAPLVLLIHGFPELAYSWRHQIPSLAAAGCRVVAPDMRGYGRSEVPEDLEAYDVFRLTGDVIGLIEHYGRGRQAIVVGHDWGALITWAVALFRPDLLAGVASLSVPYFPVMEVSLLDSLRASVGDGFHYMLYFQEPATADEELSADPIRTIRHMMWSASAESPSDRTAALGAQDRFLHGTTPAGLPSWLTPGDLEAYAASFMRTGFTGAINWYRNLDANWERMRPWRNASISCPVLFLGGVEDPVLTLTGEVGPSHPMLVHQRRFVPDLTVRLIDGGGHWLQQEQPEAVTRSLLEFIDRVR